MPATSARTAARIIGLCRIGYGGALLIAPERVGGAWVGRASASGGGTIGLRGLAIRDLLIGAITLHTVDDAARGHRWLRTAAVGDVVDAVASGLAAGDVPRRGALAGGIVASTAAVSSVLVSRWLHEEQTA